MKYLLIPLAVMLSLTAQAQQLPDTKTFPEHSQQKVQAVNHWNVIAQDIVSQLEQSHIKDSAFVYIALQDYSESFEAGLRDFIATNLVAQGYRVTDIGAKSDSGLFAWESLVVGDSEGLSEVGLSEVDLGSFGLPLVILPVPKAGTP